MNVFVLCYSFGIHLSLVHITFLLLSSTSHFAPSPTLLLASSIEWGFRSTFSTTPNTLMFVLIFPLCLFVVKTVKEALTCNKIHIHRMVKMICEWNGQQEEQSFWFIKDGNLLFSQSITHPHLTLPSSMWCDAVCVCVFVIREMMLF